MLVLIILVGSCYLNIPFFGMPTKKNLNPKFLNGQIMLVPAIKIHLYLPFVVFTRYILHIKLIVLNLHF